MAERDKCRARQVRDDVLWVLDHEGDPSAVPPSEQVSLLRDLWDNRPRVFMALSVAATLEAEGRDSSRWRGLLALALAESRYALGRLPGGEGAVLVGADRYRTITGGVGVGTAN
jgi:hypothetical protein